MLAENKAEVQALKSKAAAAQKELNDKANAERKQTNAMQAEKNKLDKETKNLQNGAAVHAPTARNPPICSRARLLATPLFHPPPTHAEINAHIRSARVLLSSICLFLLLSTSCYYFSFFLIFFFVECKRLRLRVNFWAPTAAVKQATQAAEQAAKQAKSKAEAEAKKEKQKKTKQKNTKAKKPENKNAK